jgi:hypothetical protein
MELRKSVNESKDQVNRNEMKCLLQVHVEEFPFMSNSCMVLFNRSRSN